MEFEKKPESFIVIDDFLGLGEIYRPAWAKEYEFEPSPHITLLKRDLRAIADKLEELNNEQSRTETEKKKEIGAQEEGKGTQAQEKTE